MSQKLSNWASVAEIISGFAVVVTLVILILGIRENTEVTRASMYADHIASFNIQSRDIYLDRDLAEIFEAWSTDNLASLDELDDRRVEQFVAYFFRVYETAYLAHEAGLYGADEWDRMERVARAAPSDEWS